MAMNVTLDGLRYEGPDKTVSVPSWDYIVTQITESLGPLVGIIGGTDGINSDLHSIDNKLAEWAEDQTSSLPTVSGINTTNIPAIDNLVEQIAVQALIIKSMKNHIESIESIGGGGNASFTDYESGKLYQRNNVVVDPDTETCYRVLEEYVSVNVASDVENGKLKLLAAEGQVLGVSHTPTEEEIRNYPEDAIVAVYSKSSTYVPD